MDWAKALRPGAPCITRMKIRECAFSQSLLHCLHHTVRPWHTAGAFLAGREDVGMVKLMPYTNEHLKSINYTCLLKLHS